MSLTDVTPSEEGTVDEGDCDRQFMSRVTHRTTAMQAVSGSDRSSQAWHRGEGSPVTARITF